VARAVKLSWVDAGRASQPVERVVSGQCVRPFVAEHLDGLRLAQVPVEVDHEPSFPPKALAQNSFGEPRGPNDDGTEGQLVGARGQRCGQNQPVTDRLRW
jgi:hypothetical protein